MSLVSCKLADMDFLISWLDLFCGWSSLCKCVCSYRLVHTSKRRRLDWPIQTWAEYLEVDIFLFLVFSPPSFKSLRLFCSSSLPLGWRGSIWSSPVWSTWKARFSFIISDYIIIPAVLTPTSHVNLRESRHTTESDFWLNWSFLPVDWNERHDPVNL